VLGREGLDDGFATAVQVLQVGLTRVEIMSWWPFLKLGNRVQFRLLRRMMKHNRPTFQDLQVSIPQGHKSQAGAPFAIQSIHFLTLPVHQDSALSFANLKAMNESFGSCINIKFP
jgi:hypothetical protein